MTQAILRDEFTVSEPVLYMAMELSNSRWKLAFSDGKRPREVTIGARNLAGLVRAIARAKQRFGLPASARVVSCYEAGRDGFWLHRWLWGQGIGNMVVDSASIEVNRRRRRAKTDRLDVRKLLGLLVRYCGGERDAWKVVRVPTVEEEDARRTSRELERLKKERTGHLNRLRALLASHGLGMPGARDFVAALDRPRGADGSALGPHLKAELLRVWRRLGLVQEQVRELEAARRAALKAAADGAAPDLAKAALMLRLCGIGETGAELLVRELFGWRAFNNRRELGALAGLTPTPFASGETCREQGISKAGNRRVRALMIQLAWGWLRFQPDSALSRWFQERFADGGRRLRRIGIVALARRLLIALWRFVEFGEVPEGARLKGA